MTEITLGIRLKGDASGLVGEMKISEAELKKLRTAVGGSTRDFERMTGGMNRSAGVMGLLTKATVGIGAALAGLNVGRWLGSTLLEFEKLKGQLTTVAGSSEAAKTAFAWIEDFAATTPFSLDQVVNAFIKLQSRGLEPSRDALRSYGNTASAMGKSLDQMIEAVADASTFQFERLRDFGIIANQEGDKVRFTFRGVSTEVRKNAKDITDYLRSIGDVQFGDAMSQQADTLVGATSNLGDAVASVARALGDAGLTDVLNGLARGLSSAASGFTDLIKAMSGTADGGERNWVTEQEQQIDQMVAALDNAREDLRQRQNKTGFFFFLPSEAELQKRIDILSQMIVTYSRNLNADIARVGRPAVPGVPAAPAAPVDADAEKKRLDAEEKRIDAIRRVVEASEREAATLNFTASQLAVYQLRQLDASEADITRARTALDFAAAQEAAAAADKAAAEQGAQIAKEAMERLQKMRDESLRTFEATRTPQEQFNQRMEDLNRLLQERARFGEGFGIDDETYGRAALQAVDALQQADQAQQSWLAQQPTLAAQFNALWQNTFDNFASGVGRTAAHSLLYAQNLADGMRNLLGGVAEQVLATLIEIGVKKAALWALEKAGMISSTAVSTAAAATTAVAWAPAAAAVSLATMGGNAPLAAAGISTTYALSSSLAFAGMAHDGLDFVPREGTYLLDEGERVVKKEDNQLLTRALRDNSRGGRGGVVVQQNFTFRAADAAGIDQVIRRYMPAIRAAAVGAVQEAYNARGKRGPLG